MDKFEADAAGVSTFSKLPGSTELTTLNSLKSYDLHNMPMCDNYIYFFHLDKLLIIPNYADSVQDTQQATFTSSTPLSRSAPIFSYSHSGPRTVQVNFKLHRDLMKQLNYNNIYRGNGDLVPEGSSNSAMKDAARQLNDDYVDTFIKSIQASILPVYGASEKLVNPPIVAMRLGADIFIKGVINGTLGLTYNYPVLENNKYSNVDVSFAITEVEPYDADAVIEAGSYRGLSTSLERKIYSAE